MIRLNPEFIKDDSERIEELIQEKGRLEEELVVIIQEYRKTNNEYESLRERSLTEKEKNKKDRIWDEIGTISRRRGELLQKIEKIAERIKYIDETVIADLKNKME